MGPNGGLRTPKVGDWGPIRDFLVETPVTPIRKCGAVGMSIFSRVCPAPLHPAVMPRSRTRTPRVRQWRAEEWTRVTCPSIDGVEMSPERLARIFKLESARRAGEGRRARRERAGQGLPRVDGRSLTKAGRESRGPGSICRRRRGARARGARPSGRDPAPRSRRGTT